MTPTYCDFCGREMFGDESFEVMVVDSPARICPPCWGDAVRSGASGAVKVPATEPEGTK